jgi:ribosomal-protein-alanine N-acetyltransferase
MNSRVRAAIEPMMEADLPDVARLGMLAFPAEGDPTARLREELARSWARVWVARSRPDDRSPSRVAGYLIAWLVAEEIHILNVAVEPGLRRHGIGRALVEQTLALGKQQGSAMVLLEVRRSNEGAIRLYAELGFETLRVRHAYYGDGEDALEMGLALPSLLPNPAPSAGSPGVPGSP